MPQPSRPRKGSMGFSPRSRAASEVPRFNSWPDDEGQPGLQGFAGYKAGMSHVVAINDEPNSPREGQEETVPVTVVETPPMRAVAVRAYEDTPYGKRPLTEVWTDEVHEDLERSLSVPEEQSGDIEGDIRTALDEGALADVRVITHTVPGALSSVPKKEPDVMETRVGGGSLSDRVDFALDLVDDGGEHTVTDVFRAGEYTDVAGITKGKGTQGPVKRWGVQKRKGKHARQGWRRRIGNLGPWNPSRVRSTVPQQGQTGYHQRTELNKRLIDLGDDDVSPDGGFVNYGEVDGPYALVKGSVPGPDKRLVRFRPAVRPGDQPRLDPEVRYVSTASNQG
ncbi:50S ribosomal protein L3 [Natronomonas pharaonis DSM 2160]|uniref:Large ribosomal subunit protein uL3 n=1 Tax=Natronomonas pharaonis (strain ATCC 35678 / DSM 2160 / CIP 103997 / JCM 8858 / NBRC 14720 / NCIMB 2260 / Gabara) TaxID=348780 RepID=RL3_NATPD|nr:50S ribosomal protein L3 [Natronomonas pharaonis]Q3IMY8.1 RecName: Full=Large ribosomal subunit protein uL3; AltName: Full=50S ribosomal protein L3 [Natronomonas pharaonis DSM 2160]CAI50518.1 50S ribosomal protein L3 [Natronomonas pharaonis DSM 2160]